VNTHFHWDHYQGNQALSPSWPTGVEIISSEATRFNIENRGIPRVKHEIATMPKEIDDLKAASGEGHRRQAETRVAIESGQAEAYLVN